MDVFECEYMCYKFKLKELVPDQQYNIYIYCEADDIEFESLTDFVGLKASPGKFGPGLILNYHKATFRSAFLYAQFIIDSVLLGSLIKKNK